MKGVNKAILVGNLGKDPEVRYTPSNMAIAKFSIATTRTVKKDGQRIDETEWHNCKAFGKLAEIIEKYCTKGQPVYVEGEIRTEKWQDKSTGQQRYMTGIVVNDLQMLGRSEQQPIPAANQSPHNPQRTPVAQTPVEDFDDDIPFNHV